MEKLHFSITINAPREKVWDVMLGDATYRKWTMPFYPGSYFEGGWNTGDKIKFLGPDQGGMTSVIAESRPHEFVSIEHLGFIKNGVEDFTSDEVKAFAGAHENYTFTDQGGATLLEVDLIGPEGGMGEMKEYFDKTWPIALDKLKEIVERGA